MSRFLKKSWQDKRSGWTRRVRWYEGETVRLQFEDDFGRCNRFFESKADAQLAYDNFVNGVTDTRYHMLIA